MAIQQTDLFRKEAEQVDLFSASAEPKRTSSQVTQEEVRAKMLLMLEQARTATQMPWDERTARVKEVIFPQMAKWLPNDEANQLMLEFKQAFERLRNVEDT